VVESAEARTRTLGELQGAIDAWIQENGGYWPPLSLLARLTEETGEVAREYNHRFGAKKKKASELVGELPGQDPLAMELADVLFIVLCMANEQGVDLDVAFSAMMEKLRIRDAGRFTTAAADARGR
jgi:NTP pyrophosphatase (non-canonical NTP hydrolase)